MYIPRYSLAGVSTVLVCSHIAVCIYKGLTQGVAHADVHKRLCRARGALSLSTLFTLLSFTCAEESCEIRCRCHVRRGGLRFDGADMGESMGPRRPQRAIFALISGIDGGGELIWEEF